MKFEFDHRTGTMQPKKNEEIYFAKSQGGGLIVDDNKNNIKYIIERDERITKLFGSFDKDDLNFYDMRDARMIAERVLRLFGREHKYTDYHYFLKGYHMNENFIETCSNYLGESVWGDIRKRGLGDEQKEEEGKRLGYTEDNQPIIIGSSAFSDGELIEFEGEKILRFGENLYCAIVSDGETDVFYTLDGSKDLEDGEGNMTRCFEVDSSLRLKHDLKPLKALIQDIEENDTWDDDYFFDLNITVNSKWIYFEPSKWSSYRLFFDRDDAIELAIEREADTIDSMEITEKDIERWREYFGNKFMDENWFEDAIKESIEFYYDDLNEEDAIDELLRQEVIEDTEEYFGLDEDGEIDHHQPLFDYEDYKDKYVEKRMEDVDDPVEYFISEYGDDGVKDHIDIDKLAKLCVNYDGPANSLASYDGVEREEEIDGTTYYIYRED